MSSVLKQVKTDRVQVIPHADFEPVPATVRQHDEVEHTRIQSPQEALAWAQSEVERLLAEAHQEAQTALEAAADRASAIEQDAYMKGYEEGLSRGRADAIVQMKEDMAAASSRAESILSEARETQQRWLSEMPPVFTEIIMEALRHLLNRELNLEPADIASHVAHLLQHVADTNSVEVRVHPDDFAAAREAHGTWQSSRFGSWTITIVPDPEVAVGGAEVVSDSGRVDGRMETRLDLVGQALAHVMERRVPDEFSPIVS